MAAALVLEAALVKEHPRELFGEVRACCEDGETEPLQSGTLAFGPERWKSNPRVLSQLSHIFTLHGFSLSLIPFFKISFSLPMLI